MKNPKLDPKEWDFSACLEKERVWCVHYEYAREHVRNHPDLAVGIPSLRAAISNSFGELSDTFRHNPDRPDTLPLRSTHFPVVPWLEIEPDDRGSLINSCKLRPGFDGPYTDLLVDDYFDPAYLLKIDVLKKELHFDWESLCRKNDNETASRRLSVDELFARMPNICRGPKHLYAISKDTSYAIIKIDRTKSKNDLMRAFAALLARQTGSDSRLKLKPLRKGGRGSVMEQLKQLGALRLLTQFEKPEAVAEFYQQECRTAPYGDGSSVRLAGEKAKRNLRRMEEAGRFRFLAEITYR